MRERLWVLVLFVASGCGQQMMPADDAGTVEADAGSVDAGPIDAGQPDAGAPMLTSTAFLDGGTIAPRHTCAGMNLSVPLAWTAFPAAQSYAVTLTDTNNNLLHWILWDLSPATLSLPEGVPNVALPASPAGAKQTLSYDGATYGYLGPCPPAPHVYRFDLFALDVATLPGVTTASTRAQVKAAMTSHVVGSSLSLLGNAGP